MRNGKIQYQLPIADYTFFDCHLYYSLVKAVVIAPDICKFRKDCLTGIGQGAEIRNGRRKKN